MYKKDLEKLYDLCCDMQQIFSEGYNLEKFTKEIEELEKNQQLSKVLDFLENEEDQKKAKKILSLYMKRYQVRIYIHSGDYGFCHVSNENKHIDFYYYNSLKAAKNETLQILKTFKAFKGNCASIFENGKMILTTNNDINYWMDYRK